MSKSFVRITQFYVSPPDPEPGAKTMLWRGERHRRADRSSRGTCLARQEVRVDALEVAPGTWITTPHPNIGCVAYLQNQITTYKVLARDADGDIIDGQEVTVRVK